MSLSLNLNSSYIRYLLISISDVLNVLDHKNRALLAATTFIKMKWRRIFPSVGQWRSFDRER